MSSCGQSQKYSRRTSRGYAVSTEFTSIRFSKFYLRLNLVTGWTSCETFSLRNRYIMRTEFVWIKETNRFTEASNKGYADKKKSVFETLSTIVETWHQFKKGIRCTYNGKCGRLPHGKCRYRGKGPSVVSVGFQICKLSSLDIWKVENLETGGYANFDSVTFEDSEIRRFGDSWIRFGNLEI